MPVSYKSMEASGYLNNQTFSAWFLKLYSLAITAFEWINLPPSIDERFLEMTLFWNGISAFFIDENVGPLALPVLAVGPLDVYAIPTQRTAYSYNGYKRQGLNNSNSVLIYNNYTRTPDANQIKQYAQRLYEIERSIDVNVIAQKTPVLVLCDEKSRLTMENVYKNYRGNAPVIFGGKALDPKSVTVLQTGAPFVADKLETLKRQYFQEALNFLGIEANTSEKAERMITGEIESNMGSTEALRLTRLNARKQACSKINRLFNLNIDVRFRSSLPLSQIMENNGGGAE